MTARRFPPRGPWKKRTLASLCGTRRAGAGAFCTPRLHLNGGHAGDNERCGECSVFWCVPHKGCGRGYSRSYPACNRKPRHCLSPNEGRSFALPRHAELHRAAGLFRISERGVESESRGSRKGEDGNSPSPPAPDAPATTSAVDRLSVAPGMPLCADRDALAAILAAGVLASSPAETTTNGCQAIPEDAKVELLERYPNGLRFLRVIKVKVTSPALPNSTVGFTIETGR